MPHVYLSKESYDRIIQLGHNDVGRFLDHAVELAIEEEKRQVPKSIEPHGSTSTLPDAAPTMTSESTINRKVKKTRKPKPLPEATYTVKGTFRKTLQCDRCELQFPNKEEFEFHLPCP